MRSMAAAGMVPRSAAAPGTVPPGTMRRPLTRTSVRCGPRLRNETKIEPSLPLFTCAFAPELPCSGSAWRNSPIETRPAAVIWSRLSTVTGAGVFRSLRRTRVPVTTISSVAAFLAVSAGAA